MADQNKQNPVKNNESMDSQEETSFAPGMDGMSTGTARIAIDRKLRRELLKNYDLLELKDGGRYYVARACSKDGHRFYELLIDKQSGNIQVIDRSLNNIAMKR